LERTNGHGQSSETHHSIHRNINTPCGRLKGSSTKAHLNGVVEFGFQRTRLPLRLDDNGIGAKGFGLCDKERRTAFGSKDRYVESILVLSNDIDALGTNGSRGAKNADASSRRSGHA
jgi:hypothetical protein